jgi:hypothetical protein
VSYGVALFHTNSSVMRAEKALVKASLTVKLIPTPREISSDCGIAIRFEWGDRETVHKVIESQALELAGFQELAST